MTKADELWEKYAYRSDSPPHITYTQFLAALAEYGQAREWQPIETAPKDKSIMLFAPYGLIYCGKLRYGTLGEPSQDSFSWRCDSSGRFANPTHWMPLPDAPAAIRKLKVSE